MIQVSPADTGYTTKVLRMPRGWVDAVSGGNTDGQRMQVTKEGDTVRGRGIKKMIQ